MAKKKSSWKKKLAKAALLGVAGYAAYKGLKGKGKQIPYRNVHETGAITETPGRPKWSPGVGGNPFLPKTKKWDLGGVDPGATLSAKGGRIGAKKGGRVKSMGKATRGGGVAKR